MNYSLAEADAIIDEQQVFLLEHGLIEPTETDALRITERGRVVFGGLALLVDDGTWVTAGAIRELGKRLSERRV